MFKLADILKGLEAKTPEDQFVQKLAGIGEPSAPEVNTPTVTPAVAAADPVVTPPAPPAVDEIKKQAEEADDVGRIMARAFHDELQKIAVGVVGMTPNPDAIPANPAVTLPSVDIHEADIKKVQAIIQQLTAGERMHGPQGYVQVNGQPAAATQPVVVDETPIAADKKANAEVIEKLYERYFAEDK
jgi:hypothetical protein